MAGRTRREGSMSDPSTLRETLVPLAGAGEGIGDPAQGAASGVRYAVRADRVSVDPV